MMITGRRGYCRVRTASMSRPLAPGMRMSEMITSGCSRLSATEQAVGAVEARVAMPPCCRAFSSTQRMEAVVVDDPDGFASVHVGAAPWSSGRTMANSVWPGWLSHSTSPWCWLMMFWVIARPSPVPSGRPLTMG